MNIFETMGKSISAIVGVFTDLILVFPGGWGDTLPGMAQERHYHGEAGNEHEGTQRGGDDRYGC